MAGDTRGRKPKLTKERVAGLVALLEAGIPRNTACSGVGIDSRTLRIWMTRATKGEPKFVALSETIDGAIARGRTKLLMQIARHGNREFRAPAWILEHAHSDEFSAKSQVKIELGREREKLLDLVEKVLGVPASIKLLEALAAEDVSRACAGTTDED